MYIFTKYTAKRVGFQSKSIIIDLSEHRHTRISWPRYKTRSGRGDTSIDNIARIEFNAYTVEF